MEMKNMHGGPCLESSKREFDNLADFLGMDDLLDFSNDDIAGPILGPSLISPADICIPPPCEEIAELEWLSNFVEDDESFYYGANFSGNGESKPTAAEGYNTSSSISITTTNNTAPSPSPSPSSSTSTSSSASLGNMAMAMAMAMTMTMGGSNSNSNNTSSSTSSSSNSSNSCDGSLQVQTGTPVPGRARSKRPRKEGAASGWVSSHSRLTLSHPEPSSLSPESSYYKGYYEDSSNITFLDCSSTSTMAAESTPFLIHFKPSPTNPSTISHQPSTYNTPTPPPLPKKVTIKQSSWHAKTAPPSSTNSSSSTTTTTTSTTTTGETGQEAGGQCRKCLHCGSQKTPQWRAGPLGPKTLCNACGVRHKSGRLFPEYRPVASPTFVASVHSNSHRKVMEIRGLKQRTYYHHQHHHQQQQHHVAITTVTTTGTTSCSPPSYSFPSFN